MREWSRGRKARRLESSIGRKWLHGDEADGHESSRTVKIVFQTGEIKEQKLNV